MIELKVEGMTCGHCEQAVRQALAAVPGVTAVLAVDRSARRAVVEGEAELAALIAAIKDEGFQATAA
jgi:copper chaperone